MKKPLLLQGLAEIRRNLRNLKLGDTGPELSPHGWGIPEFCDSRAAQLETLQEIFERLSDDERADFFREQFLAAARQPTSEPAIQADLRGVS